MIKIFETTNGKIAIPFFDVDLIEMSQSEDGTFKVTVYDNNGDSTEITIGTADAES